VALRVVPAGLPPSRIAGPPLVAAVAAATGAIYAWSAYAIDPLVLPILIAAGCAIVVGLWRLEWGLGLMLFLTPFSENASISDPAAAPLRLAVILWAMLLVAAEGGRLLRSDEQIALPPLTRAAIAFVLVALIGVPVATDQGAALGKVLMLVGSVLLFVLGAVRLREWRRIEVVLGLAMGAGLLVSLHTLYQQITGDVSLIGFVDASGAVEYRVTSVFFHPNQLAGYLVVLIALAAGLWRHFTRTSLRVLAVTLIVFGLAAVLVTYSRGALVGLLGLPLLYAREPRAWPVLACGAVLIALLAPAGWHDRIAGAGSLDAPEIASRVDIWGAAVEAFEQKPVLGWGLNNFPNAYVALERPARDFLGGGRFDAPPTAHNLYLNVASEQGLLGIGALLLLVVAALRMTGRLRASPDARDRALGRALLGVGVVLALHNLFDVTFVEPKTSALVWGLLGLGAARALALEQSEDA
jgi:putative inorganic carbon (HCO3(-)) transporter